MFWSSSPQDDDAHDVVTKIMVTISMEQALYAIVFSLGFAFEVNTRMLRTQIHILTLGLTWGGG